jgi:predicted RecB family nuclease
MQLIDGVPVFSATDLVGYLACEHLTALERSVLLGVLERPHRHDRELEIIRKRGFAHEERYLDELRADGRHVVIIDRDDDADRGEQIRSQAEATRVAMASGADVIYQATFFDGRWIGYADFLLKRDAPDRPSVWGPYHYEVADTKLARHVKAGAVLQVCSYVEQLERLQGVRPERMWIVLGGSARQTADLRVDDFMAYYRAAKERFEATVLEPDGGLLPNSPSTTYPEPVEHCDVCRWAAVCAQRRRDDDHLSLVAGITSRQRTALGTRDIDTVVRLANAPLPFTPPLDGTSAASVERVREQARIQVEGRGLPKPIHELLLPPPGEPIEAERGLAMLPPPSAGDLFLDLEGDPYAFDDGIDYLFGLLDTAGAFTAIWSFDPQHDGEISLAGEKDAFERLIDLLIARLEADPGMHVYHYASYEPTALKRLMGRHATREDEVDRLLRGGVLVDLFRAVRQGVRASVESYSIKRIEPLYDFVREIDLRDAGSSIVAFEEWLELGDGDRPTSAILDEIARYNRDDVVSTVRLRDWLEGLRGELATMTGQAVPRPTPVSGEAPVDAAAADARVAEAADGLSADVAVDLAERSPDEQGRWLLAQLLSWHRREKKAAYWEFFHRMDMDATELTVDKGALGPLEIVGPIGEPYRPTERSKLRQRWRYRFAPQDYDIGPRAELYDPGARQRHPDEPMKAWRIPATMAGVDAADGTIDLEWMADVEPVHPAGIVPLDSFNDGVQRAALLRLGEWVADHGLDADGPWRAARDLLLRRSPRVGQPTNVPLRAPDETELEAARRLAVALDHTSLAIQGPPGSGKTYTGARMILSLVAAGCRIGISSNSHKVIGNFIGAVRMAAAEEGAAPRIGQKISEDGQGVDFKDVTVTTSNDVVRHGLRDGTFDVVGGTSWLWASDKSDGLVDVLFVDEAGQVALANVLAMAGAASSIVLLGDPQQLDQPLQGSHPPGADRSALAHLLDGRATIDDRLGLFLEHTHRLHPAITAFTSSAFYDDRLESRADLVNQSLRGPAPLRGAGVRYVPSDHVGADSLSRSEALQVAGLVRALVDSGSTWTDREGVDHRIGYADVLVVAPYNAQVAQIASLLPTEARVGTVDKFQGQEAPISVYSMTSSSPDDAPRGLSFLYSRNRLNVATSRARCIAVVVAEPALLRVRARSPEQMRLANALCQFVEAARGI